MRVQTLLLLAGLLASPAMLNAAEPTAGVEEIAVADATTPAAADTKPGEQPPSVSEQASEADAMALSALAGGARVMQGDFGPQVRLQVVLPLTTSPSGMPLSLVVPLSTTYTGSDEGDIEVDAVAFELSPSVRTGFSITDGLALYLDAGLGIVHSRVRTRIDQQFVGKVTEVATKTTAMLRFALGVRYEINPKLAVTFEPMGLGYDFDGGAAWTFLLGAAYHL